jgi:hypothetical protein
MKRLVLISLLVIYGFVSLGLRTTLRTCCGELTAIGPVEMGHCCGTSIEEDVCTAGGYCCALDNRPVRKEAPSCCSGSGSASSCAEAGGCCGEEEVFLLFEEDQITPDKNETKLSKGPVGSLASVSRGFSDLSVIHNPGIFVPDTGPPERGVPLWILHTALIVYG